MAVEHDDLNLPCGETDTIGTTQRTGSYAVAQSQLKVVADVMDLEPHYYEYLRPISFATQVGWW